jgi:ATP-binding cassette subfamily B protein
MTRAQFFKRFGQFVRYYRPHRALFFLDMGAAVTQSVLTVLLPLVVHRIFTVYLPAMDLDRVVWAGVLLMALTAVIAGAEYVGIRWGHTLGVRMEADMRRDLFVHLQKLSFNYFDRTKTGHLMSRLSNDLTQIAEVGHHCPEDGLIAALTLGGALAMMLAINPLLTVITLAPLPFILIWGSIFQGKMHRGFREVRRKVADINSRVENSIQGIREVKSFCNEEMEIEKFGEVNAGFRLARENVYGVMAGFHAGMMFIIQSYSLLFVAAGAILTYYGRATLPEVLVFVMYSRYFTMPIFRMVNFIEQFQQGFAAFERFGEVIDEQPEIVDPVDPATPARLSGALKIENVSFTYPAAVAADGGIGPEPEPALRDVSLDIPAGSTVALVGESGAGKTTLAALIPRFYEVGAGRIAVDGIDIRRLPQEFLRGSIGIVRQSPFLFDCSIRENILFGRPGASEEEMIEAAKLANIYDFVMSLPDGFDSEVGEQGVKLSGGQKQRISLARVFLKNPPILIFDEATSALDNESEALVQSSMRQLCRGRTTIVIAHRLSTVRNVDTIYCLQGGRIVEAGTHAELLKLGGYYFRLYSMHTF